MSTFQRWQRWLWVGALVWATAAQAQTPTLEPGPFRWLRPTAVSSTLTLVAVGDVLLHEPLHRQMLTSPEGAQSLWSEVIPWIHQADLAYANLEGPIAPGTLVGGRPFPDPGSVFDRRVYTSYPAFNYHARLAQDLKRSGFDVVSTANNHALDRGARGADLTLEALNQTGLAHMGTRRQAETSEAAGAGWVTVSSKAGWRVAWMACSFSTNGIPDRYHQVLNCFSDRVRVLDLVRHWAHTPGIDAVVVTPHVGVEYETRPRPEVVRLDEDLIDAGALIVLGSHPHVLQPWTQYRAKDGRMGLIVYSLGNFVSGQFQREATRSSALIWVQLTRSSAGQVTIAQTQFLPLRMERQGAHLQVVPLNPVEETPAERHRFNVMFQQSSK